MAFDPSKTTIFRDRTKASKPHSYTFVCTCCGEFKQIFGRKKIDGKWVAKSCMESMEKK